MPLSEGDSIQSLMGSANSFLKTYSKAKILFLSHKWHRPEIINSRILHAPIGAVL